MAMQTGLGASKILFLAGAGYGGTIMFNNGKLSELLAELQVWMDKQRTGGDGDSDYADAMAQQVKRLAMEVRQLASARQITVLNGNGQMGNLSGLIVPGAVLGALGYGYMWWKGVKFSDLMYVTKRSMAAAVTNLKTHLDQVTEAVSAAKTHLTQRIQHVDDKLDSQKEISKAIQNDVNTTLESVSQIGSDLWQLQRLVCGLDGRMGSLEEKQDLANMGVLYLCNFAGGKNAKMPKALEEQLKSSGRTRSLAIPEIPSLTGLKEIADDISRVLGEPATDSIQAGIDISRDMPQNLHPDQPKPLLRLNSARC